MSTTLARPQDKRSRDFRHEALLYEGPDEFAARCATFVRDGLEAHEPVLVLVVPWKIALLRSALGGDAAGVMFGDMEEIGRNPARIIPVWSEFVAERGAEDGAVRGIGEPIWPSRSADELVESQRHEALINVAFADAPAWILCPYDTNALSSAVIAEAHRSHPLVASGGIATASTSYRGITLTAQPFDAELPEPVQPVFEMSVDDELLYTARRFVFDHARAFGLNGADTEDLVFSINEVATNSIRHAGGGASLRTWQDADAIVFEVRDGGRIDKPLAGRERPPPGQEHGHGLWLVNQMCDLVQLRTTSSGSVVRVHMRRR
jgi:anti-sigma regulatory factor (Ser/Thr protein kinase)